MTNVNLDINLHYITRVEGHGNIAVNVKEGTVEKVEWQVPEAPRFFEAMVVGQKWDVIHHITSRICGICSIGHTLASLKATEAAFGIKLTARDLKLRRLAIHAENLQSHLLHLGYLVLPDLLGVGSVIPLASSHPEELKTVVRLHRAANEMSDLVCGRTTHPQRLIPGGFTKVPSRTELKELKEALNKCWVDINAVAKLVHALASKLPNFTRETEFIALTSKDEYAIYDGNIGSTDTESAPVSDYLKYTNEFIVPQSTAKYAKHNRASFMVGALARVNKNYDQLTNRAKIVAEMFGLKPVCHNPYMNNVAQLVEIVHSWEDAIKIIDELVADTTYDQQKAPVAFTPKASYGVGAVEVPRGILYHAYTYDDKGFISKANCIIPTNQNHANIQLDMEALVPQIMQRPKREVELTLEMLVRAYDPCISCSTHMLNIEWKE
ncbi:MAG: Ni/Fe hydrogenase subunit alpha [Deltaproteobacteria bacterium CG11_big_fil_rev_8_21_14_0_20_49_13]|nr:MAG: Ni/Fe hydrogenase subunit alpha [Deltaproteobacteria bacterium CG11_big_fil_rev_8_21_14_0_20_49_13]